MQLLIFAHRKEADAFFNYFILKPTPFYFDGLYQSEKFYLLISGEGIQSTTEKLIAILAQKQFNISEIVNLGVAGSVNPQIKKGTTHFVRTVYAHHFERLEFKSFSTKGPITAVDCITAFDRILDINNRKKLAMFADIVDRELWAIGSAANLFKLNFIAIKHISDDLDSENFCQLVISDAEHFSQQLLEHYLNWHQEAKVIPPVSENIISSNKLFYFTVTQKRNYDHLKSQLQHKNISEEKLLSFPFVRELENLDITPKERTKLLLVAMMELINPIHRKINESLDKVLLPYKHTAINITHDRELESNKLLFTFAAYNSDDLLQIIELLKRFPIDDVQEIFLGKFDV